MDNFKKFKHGRTSLPKTLDGIMAGRGSGNDASFTDLRRPKSYLPEPSPMGSFGRKDGFHSFKQDQIAPRQTGSTSMPLSVGAGTDTIVAVPLKPEKTKKPQKRWSWRKRLGWSSLGLVIVTTLVGGFLFAKGYINLRKVFKGGALGAPALQKNVDPTRLNGEGDGRINVLLLGKGGDGHEGPDLTDTVLVASIDPINNEAALLSIPRDLWVKNVYGTTKINAVYANAKYAVLNGKKTPDQTKRAEDAGLKAIDDVVSKTIGIPIHYHIIVDFKAFQEAVDTVGGIDVNVTTPLRDTLWLEDTGKNYTIDVKPGVQHFDGRKALVYARSRYTSPRGDFDRTERQRGVILALKSKVFSLGTFGNPVRISQLIGTFGNHIQANLSVNEILRLYDIAKLIDGDKVASDGLADLPNNFVTIDTINDQSVVVPRIGTFDYSEIQNYVRNTLKDGYIKNENPNIMVLNGTSTPGLATIKANKLKSFGYNVTQIGDAPTKNYSKTILVDLRSGSKKYTKHYLEQRFNTTAVSKVPDLSINFGNTDFVIILGQNESTTN